MEKRKIETCIFAGNQGEGIILTCSTPEKELFEPRTVELVSETLTPGVETTLGNLHNAPMRFVGHMAGEPKALVFHLGDDGDLFGNKRYYAVYHFIAPNRLFRMYSHIAGRDWNWSEKGQEWK